MLLQLESDTLLLWLKCEYIDSILPLGQVRAKVLGPILYEESIGPSTCLNYILHY